MPKKFQNQDSLPLPKNLKLKMLANKEKKAKKLLSMPKNQRSSLTEEPS